jgi:hypothetical protein
MVHGAPWRWDEQQPFGGNVDFSCFVSSLMIPGFLTARQRSNEHFPEEKASCELPPRPINLPDACIY